ncbi:hypothetical protein GCM10018966_045070 [Streptomyces yanii]
MSAAADAVTDVLRELRSRFMGEKVGQLIDYIPQLALADPDAFGLALISMDGHRYSAGEADAPFTMQSVSKPFVYALALSVLGLDEVCRWVNAEPSGEAFNAISLERATGRPANAMVNAGGDRHHRADPGHRRRPEVRPYPGLPEPVRRTAAGRRRGGVRLRGRHR